MIRTVITFLPAGRSIFVSLDKSPILYEQNSTRVNLSKILGVTMVDRGKAMLKLISERDPVRAGLESAFALPETSPPAPLYFHIRAMAADVVEWEQIYSEQHGFCALDPRWPIGRIASTVRQVKGQAFMPPLKIVAVLAAAGRDGTAQLRALADATEHAAVTTCLHVITGDDDLADEARQLGATAEMIKGTPTQVCRQIASAQPQLLHILCHGGMVGNAPTLAFATAQDVDAGEDPYGSVRVFVPELVKALTDGSNPWLVVLNACQTADATHDIASGAIAHDMVSAGLTAVIGMRRTVELLNADRFCALLYPEVLDLIARAFTEVEADPARADAVLDWAPALTAPRRAMSGVDPCNGDAWLDPVLYAQSEELQVAPPAPQAVSDRWARLHGLRGPLVGVLAGIDAATADPDFVREIQDRIAAIDRELAELGTGEQVAGPAGV